MINLNELTPHHPTFQNIVASYLPHTFAGGPQAQNPLKSDLREARKVYKIKKSVHLITQMNALIKKRRLPTLPHCIAVPSTPGLRGSNLHKKL